MGALNEPALPRAGSDIFGEYEPRLEFVPNPSPGFRAYVSAAYTY